MVIEWLTFRLPQTDHARFLALDAEIWTAVLATCPGFLGKEVWRAGADPDALHLIIRWQARADWHAVPPALLAETEARFNAALGRAVPVHRCTDLDVLG